MKISIQKLQFEAILGILDFERKNPQLIEVDCEITYDYRKKSCFLDYAEVAKFLENTIKKEKFHLIEEAIETLFEKMRDKFPRIETIKITIYKPDILPNCRICVSDFRSYL